MSNLPPADVAGIISRLQSEDSHVRDCAEDEAADALTAQAARIAELEDDKRDIHRVCLSAQERESEALREVLTEEFIVGIENATSSDEIREAIIRAITGTGGKNG